MREIDGIQTKGSHNAFFISADNIYPESELIDQDQNKRKLDTDIFFLCCDFRILFLITADALYQETRTKVTKLFYFIFYPNVLDD